MKLNEIILLEYREQMDRYNNYGQWIDTHNKQIYPVQNKMGHKRFIESNPDIFGLDNGFGVMNYEPAFKNGFVRVAHLKPEQVWFMGMPQDLLKISSMITGTASVEDVDFVIVAKLNDPGDPVGDTTTFELPPDRIERAKKIKEIQELLLKR